MAGTQAGGIKAAAKNLANDPDFYKKIGAKGGANSNTGGFAYDNTIAQAAGSKGGTRGKRGYKIVGEDDEHLFYIEKATGKERAYHKVNKVWVS